MRTIIEIPKQTIRNLDKVGKQEKKSRAAIIREAIGMYLERKELSDAEGAFGIWKKRRGDGLEYQEKIRSEWS
jgi:metal-responsive CopG/Arc/MetJ family transcriptional regulator